MCVEGNVPVAEGWCADCGVGVVYKDNGSRPWYGVDGSSVCSAASERSRMMGQDYHRLKDDVAAQVWASFYHRTGLVPRHDVTRSYLNIRE